jgi:predicted ArsR family transcriptional regulator
MNEQLDILDYLKYPHSPGSKRPGTSRDAATAIAPRARTLRDRALHAIKHSSGLTADECAAKLGESVLAIRPRITELSKLGHIRETERRRKNASGHSAIVWVAA